MDLCGYNTDISWFLNLTQHLCIRYLKSLLDIWEYRSQIDEETKHKIYPKETLSIDLIIYVNP